MELEEAKKVLLIIQDKINWELQFKENDIRLQGCINAIDTVLQELDRLQKEIAGKDCLIETLDHNEEVKDEYIKHLEEKTRNSITKDKIREEIEELEKLISEALLECGSASKEFTIYVYQQRILQDLLKEVGENV